MSETVAGAVEQVAAPKMITPDTFASVLPAHIGPEKYTRWALTLLKRPELAQVATTDAGRLSIMSALLDCATLGLEPGRTYHLVPYKGVVTGITDYKGEVELIWRAVQRPVVASLVYAKDEFAIRGANTPPLHTGDWFAEDGRGEIRGGYAYVDYGRQVYSLVVYMSEADFKERIKRARQHGGAQIAEQWPESWRLKTLVHQLRKWVPWSAEVRDQR